jgi:uncharacterized membrane protein YecN with MAPEG domain
MHITGLYVALAALLVVVLSSRISLRRRALRIGIGDGDDKELRKRIRAQANAIEYLPLALLLLLSLEWNQTQPAILHACGIVLIVARVLHGIGLSRSSGTSPERMIGTALTWLLMLAMALLLLWQFVVLY